MSLTEVVAKRLIGTRLARHIDRLAQCRRIHMFGGIIETYNLQGSGLAVSIVASIGFTSTVDGTFSGAFHVFLRIGFTSSQVCFRHESRQWLTGTCSPHQQTQAPSP